MTGAEAFQKSFQIIEFAGLDSNKVNPRNFLEYAPYVVDVLKHHWTKNQRENTPWVKDWLLVWKALFDDFDDMVRRDPAMLYKPQHSVAEDFHKANAWIRYFRTGNRCSKTQSGYMEHYWFTTGQHPYRTAPVGNTFIVGLDYNKYQQAVFLPKMLAGEDDNVLSPLFPDGGKWFYHYDKMTHTITVACRECAEKNRAGSCPGHHRKSTIRLYSDERGWEVLQGFTGRLGHFDEHIESPKTFREAMQRLMTADHSSFIVTGTPLHGEESWETKELAEVAEGPKDKNTILLPDGSEMKRVEMFQISQYDAGIVPHWKIDSEAANLDEFEKEARVYGRPAPLADQPVFNRTRLAVQRKNATDPSRGILNLRLVDVGDHRVPIDIVQAGTQKDVNFSENEDGPLRVWEPPKSGGWYIIGVDTAAGLDRGTSKRAPDYSCASVLEFIPDAKKNGLPSLRLVAQYHGYVNVHDYADEVKKLGIWYNNAVVGIELTGGLGTAVMQRMANQLFYWNLYSPPPRPEHIRTFEASRRGIDTNQSTKPMMVGFLQALIEHEQISVPDLGTIREMNAFGQERTDSGLSTRFRGIGGAKDDRVMALCLACYVAFTPAIEEVFAGTMMTVQEAAPITAQDEDDIARWKLLRDEIKRGILND